MTHASASRFSRPAGACLLALLALGLLAAANAAHAATCRVATDGSAGNDGSSWLQSMTLQDALGDANCTEIWVKAGVYKPVVPTDPNNVTEAERAVSFDVLPGVALYGGFAGNETARAQRDPDAHRSVLSGDIGGNDVVDAHGVTPDADDIVGSNSFQVVVMDGTTGAGIGPDTLLDGLTITAGEAASMDQWGGGGLFCDGRGAGSRCSPRLVNMRFVGNRATSGGAMYFAGSAGDASPTLVRVVVRGNEAAGLGGGLAASAATGGGHAQSRVTIVGARFIGNRATAVFSAPTDYDFNGGGAIGMYTSGYKSSNVYLSITDSTFANNTAAANGGALLFFSDPYALSGAQNLTLSNSTFVDNHAGFNGGAMVVVGDDAPVQATLRNVTLADNTAGIDGGAVAAHGDDSTNPLALNLYNTILWDNAAANSGSQIANTHFTATIDHGLVQGGCPANTSCTALVTNAPLLGPLADNGGFSKTMLPAAGSAAVDAGDDASCTAQDQRGIQRPQGWHCDIGAVEVGGQPVLTVSDGNDYARYGQTIRYVVTLHNPASALYTGLTVTTNVPAQIDSSAMHWVCLSAAGVCTTSGNGPLNDISVNLAPYGSISWLVSAPVREDASEAGGIQFTATADAMDIHLSDTDTDALGLFRDGFDVTGANGTQSIVGVPPVPLMR